MRNRTGPREPKYVAGPTAPLTVPAGTYVGMLSVTLPREATAGRIEGIEQLAVAGADGPTRVVAAPVTIGRGRELRMTVRFELPRDIRSMVLEPSARMPRISWTSAGEKWEDGTARTLRW